MKTPEEIKKGLECCPGQYSSIGCGKCPYSIDGRYCGRNGDQPMKDALVYIQQIESTYSQLSKVLCDKENATLEEVLQAASQVKVELETVKRERDAEVEDAAMGECCETCLYGDTPVLQNPCMCCYGYNLWKWQGVCPENTEVQSNG